MYLEYGIPIGASSTFAASLRILFPVLNDLATIRWQLLRTPDDVRGHLEPLTKAMAAMQANL